MKEEEAQPERKRKRARTVTEADLYDSYGLKVEWDKAKICLRIFLQRYFARDVKKGEDFTYVCERQRDRHIAYLLVPAWDKKNPKKYWGTPKMKKAQAECSAASTFLAIPEVANAAEGLPPPWRKVIAFIETEHGDQDWLTKKEMANELYNELAEGCATAINDGRAWVESSLVLA